MESYANLRVPAMVNRLSNTTPREKPSLPKVNYHSSEYHTHNNNQPFSYTTTRNTSNSANAHAHFNNTHTSPIDSSYLTLDRRNLKSPKEVIYAQVVVDPVDQNGGGRNGLHKRTVHTTFNGHAPSQAPSYHQREETPEPEIIEHFVYKRNSNKENLLRNNDNSYSSSYDKIPTYNNKSRHNVTTVLINNDDDEDYNIKSAASRTNELFNSYHHRERESERERPFFYGDLSSRPPPQNSNSSSSPGYYQFDSSRSPSPVARPQVTSAKLVREADRSRDATYISSAKLVNTYTPPYHSSGPGHQTHTDYSYMTSKLGSSNVKSSSDAYRRQQISDHDHSMPTTRGYNRNINLDRGSDVVDMKLLQNSAPLPRSATIERKSQVSSNHRMTNSNLKPRSPPKNGFSNHTNSLEKMYNDKNNRDESVEKKTTVTTTTSKSEKSSGGGIISTLLRRNKNKDKGKKSEENLATTTKDEEKDGKIKRQRAKFLSVFLEKNFTSKGKAEKNNSANQKYLANNKQITDSEIEEVERRRDGEYHSWSSGDDFYRFQNKTGAQLHRGQSYNFADYKKDSDYEQNDYRRNLAINQRGYTSATLGRPSGHPEPAADYNDSIAFRSKSLDRRAFRNSRETPQIIITPNSPPIETTDKWASSYEMRNKREPEWPRKEFSKSTIELGSDHQRNSNLRYFGDTDMEDTGYSLGRRDVGDSYDNSTLNSRPSTKIYNQSGNGYNNQWSGRHVSRKDNSNQMKFQKLTGPKIRNSSESDNERSGSSQRSVYLHAPAVASIPTTLPKRALSRDDISNYSGHQRQTKHLARSMSVLSPWRPRNYQEKYEVNYNANGFRADGGGKSRPPRLPRSPVQKSVSPGPNQNQLTAKNNNTAKSSTLVSRSKSMPKGSKLNWFSRRRKDGDGGK